MSSLNKRDLFGGAITSSAAKELVDVSDLRQVPDTQEVFLYPNTNASIVVEILEKVDKTKHQDIIKFHFDSLAHDNDAQNSSVSSISVVQNDREDETPSAIVLKGQQVVSKFNKTALDRVLILMAVFRVEHKNVDVVVTFNVPLESADALQRADPSKMETDFNSFVKSFQIVDFDLFA
ncbi:hypothetical protein D9611_004351 [Ephemerocybe angulata]|uniref:Ran guanine nucleotide release factor n=1 Tax=Ephemerocybe angulata TaxID=980116 RepID=A0A8H5F655_9AGAR|nr:hypothetical protein D9611_004351 [Tulosesus angulatus]